VLSRAPSSGFEPAILILTQRVLMVVRRRSERSIQEVVAVRVRNLAVLGALALVTLVVAAEPAVAGGGGHGGCTGFTRGAALSIQDNCFQGTAHIVDRGSTVTVTNQGQAPHDFTAVDGSFASGLLQPGQSYELTVDTAGAIPFYCSLHGTSTGSGMAGVLFVEQPAPPASAPQPASVQASATKALAEQAAANSSPAATTAVHDSAPVYLAAGALVLSSLALVVVIPLVRRPRPESAGPHMRPE
jgi:plastocyanin